MSRLRSNKVVNQAGSGAPELTYGAVVPGTGTISGAGKVSIGGSITAGSFHGDGSGLSGVGDPSALKDGSNVKVQAISTGANVTGNLAATGNVTAVDGTFSGNLTVQGTTTTIDTAVTSVDSLAIDGLLTTLGSVGIGTTNPGNFNGNADDLVIFGAGHQGLTIRSGTAHDGSIMFNDTNDANQRGIIRYIHTDDAMAFHTSGGEAVRITSAGLIGISSTAPKTDVDISQKTGAVALPQGTTAQRPSGSAPYIRKNTTNNALEYYDGTSWVEIITDYFPTGSVILG